MKYRLANLKDYPFQPITDFAAARNWFVHQLPDNEYVLFTSDHEEIPQMLHDYIRRLEPRYPYYKIRLVCLINGVWDPLKDLMYAPNLCSNKMRFVGKVHETARPRYCGGTIDVPMIHNSDGSHGYKETRYHQIRNDFILYRLLVSWRGIMWTRYGRGLFRLSKDKKRY